MNIEAVPKHGMSVNLRDFFAEQSLVLYSNPVVSLTCAEVLFGAFSFCLVECISVYWVWSGEFFGDCL